jgi:hypothetical protein
MDARKRRADVEAVVRGPNEEERRAATQAVWAASIGMGPPAGRECRSEDRPALAALAARAVDEEGGGAWAEERKFQCRILLDLVGNPFRPPPLIAPSVLAWNARAVRRLAESTYAERQMPAGTMDPTGLGVLADALEEAGCTDAGVLGHLRGPGPHVRGCWPVCPVRDLCTRTTENQCAKFAAGAGPDP